MSMHSEIMWHSTATDKYTKGMVWHSNRDSGSAVHIKHTTVPMYIEICRKLGNNYGIGFRVRVRIRVRVRYRVMVSV